MRRLRSILLIFGLVTFANPATAQFVPSKESLADVYPGKAYSPYAQRKFPNPVYWGDTHLHTELSVDAGLFGARLGLDEAYRFARGEEVMASSGQPAKLSRPLDWLVIADHSDAMVFSMISRRVTRVSSSSTRPSPGTRDCRKAAMPRLQQPWT